MKSCEEYGEKSGGIFARIYEMRKRLLGVIVSAQALGEPHPSRDAIHQGSGDDEIEPAHLVVISGIQPVSVRQVKVGEKMKIQEYDDETVELISEPEVCEADVIEWSGYQSPLK